MKLRFTYITFLMLLSATIVSGQRPVARIAELEENNESYGVMMRRYDALSLREDSVETRIEDIRKLFTGNVPGKEKYSDELIGLEIELYRLRDTMDTVAREINALEQEWIIQNARSGHHGGSLDTVPAGGTAYLVNNDFFKEALPPEEYRQLLLKQEMERETERLIVEIKENYDRMAAMSSVYRDAGKEQADSLYLLLGGLMEESDSLEKRMREIWDDLFDSKVYLYNYILDKTGMTNTMADMERLMVEVSLRSAETRGRYMYDAVASYPFRKSLLLHYETALASERGLTLAADSLKRAAAAITAPAYYLLHPIDTEERLFLDYADIAVAKPPVYNTANPIPGTEIYEKGTIYRILLGVYSKPQAVGLFRGVYPLSVERKEDRKYYYYAGGFPSYEDAEAAVDRLKKTGFANPRIAAWHNGEYFDTDNARNTPRQSAGGMIKYRVEITGAVYSLSEQVRTVIEEAAPGREISKVAGQDGISTVFVVGSFDDPGTAGAVAAAIISADPSLGATVVQ